MSKNESSEMKELNNEELSFEELLAESSFSEKELKIGDRVKAKIVSIDSENVFIDIGTRIEAIIKKSEFKNSSIAPEYGNEITVYLTGKRGANSYCSFTRGISGDDKKKRIRKGIPLPLVEAYNKSMSVKGKVSEVVKGGFKVKVIGFEAFCPISLIENGFCDNQDAHLNKEYSFLINKLDENDSNVVLSRKDLLLKERETEAAKLWESLELDQVYDGTVSSIKDFGIFVNIGGAEGLVHISELSYSRVDNPAALFNKGDEVKVKVIDINSESRRIGLSIRALQKDPWLEEAEKLSEGSLIEGRVARIKPFGVFVEIVPGVDGLLHISEIKKDKNIAHPKEVFNEGDTVTAKILSIDLNSKRIALGSKDQQDDYATELERINKEQEQSGFGQMAGLLDDYLKK